MPSTPVSIVYGADLSPITWTTALAIGCIVPIYTTVPSIEAGCGCWMRNVVIRMAERLIPSDHIATVHSGDATSGWTHLCAAQSTTGSVIEDNTYLFKRDAGESAATGTRVARNTRAPLTRCGSPSTTGQDDTCTVSLAAIGGSSGHRSTLCDYSLPTFLGTARTSQLTWRDFGGQRLPAIRFGPGAHSRRGHR